MKYLIVVAALVLAGCQEKNVSTVPGTAPPPSPYGEQTQGRTGGDTGVPLPNPDPQEQGRTN